MAELKNKFQELVEEAWGLRYKNPAKTFEIGETILDQSDKAGDGSGLAYGKLLIGVSNFLRSKNEHILEYLTDALNYFESDNDESGQVRALIFLTNVCDNLGDLAKGLNYGKRGLKIVENSSDREAESDLLSTIGLIYTRMSDYEHAIESFKKSLSLREAIGNYQAMASSLNLIARTYSQKGDFQDSLEYYKKSLKIREDNKDFGSLPWSYLGIASLYEKMNDDQAATENYLKGMELNKSSKDPRSKLYCLWGMGRILTRSKKIPEALEHLVQALEICVSLNFKSIEYEIHLSLADAYEAENNLDKTLEHFKLFHKIKEEVLSAETSNKLKNQEISFAIEKSQQEAEIHRLKHVELKKAFEIIEEKNQHITNTIRYALRIQNAILPVKEEIEEFLPSSFILFKPKDIVSGDFYWFAHKDDKVMIAAVDCTGHGVPGALMSMIGNSLLNQIVLGKGLTAPSEILNNLHQGVKTSLKQKGQSTEFGGETRDGMDVAFCSLYVDKGKPNDHSIILEYAGANRPLLLFRGNQLTEIKADKYAIGGSDLEKARTFSNHKLELTKGDTVYIFSDGIVDQFNEEERKVTIVRLRELLQSILDLPMEKQKQKVEKFLLSWKGNLEQTDDVLMIGIRI